MKKNKVRQSSPTAMPNSYHGHFKRTSIPSIMLNWKQRSMKFMKKKQKHQLKSSIWVRSSHSILFHYARICIPIKLQSLVIHHSYVVSPSITKQIIHLLKPYSVFPPRKTLILVELLNSRTSSLQKQ